ncbi:hypothetical protein [Microbacterium sp.]|uniref:hypothetical protein n=1 Tax=Microbacterium sp. TaxID=51671 RepID=UPI00333F595A
MTRLLDLSPSTPRTSPWPSGTGRTLAIGAFLALVLGGLAWLRLPAVARDTFWAEDGRNFVQSAMFHGWGDLFTPYGGYLHLLPRVLANTAVMAVPLDGYALFMSGAASLVAGVCAGIVWMVSRQHVGSGWALVIGASTVLAPLAAREVLGNAANIHTILMWTLFWVLLYTPTRRSTAALLALFALVAALTEVQAVFLLPLLLWRSRSRLRRIVYGGTLAGVLAQLLCVLLSPRKQTAFGHVEPLSYPYGFVINALMPIVLPTRAIGPVLSTTAQLVPLLLVAAFGAAFLVLLRGASSTARVIVSAALLLAVLTYVAGVYTTPLDLYDYASHSPAQLRAVWLARYGVLPSMLVISALCVAAGDRTRTRPEREGMRRSEAVRKGVAFGVVTLLLLSFACFFSPSDTRRSHGPAWQPQVVQAREECAEGAAAVTLAQTLGWSVEVPCGRIR